MAVWQSLRPGDVLAFGPGRKALRNSETLPDPTANPVALIEWRENPVFVFSPAFLIPPTSNRQKKR
jgi:hypothetical protein